MKYPLLVLATLAFTVSCSKVQEVEKNMNEMKSTTELMSTTTDDMKETTTVMYQQIRSKEAEDTRNKKFIILKSKDEDFGSKIAAAAVYFKSFEYQLWSDQSQFDDKKNREDLILDGVNEFTRRASDLYSKINTNKMSPVNSGKKHNDEMAFYALAATMHMNHHFQEELVKERPQVQLLSFYDIVKEALRKDNQGMALNEFEEILMSGINKEIMTELIKARVDMIAALALKNLTDKREMTLGQKIKAGIFKITAGKLGTIQIPEVLSTANESTKNQIIKYLDASVKARRFLASINLEKKLEKTLLSAFSHIQIIQSEQEQEAALAEIKEKDIEIKMLIDELIQ
jgi:hypothetical protein